MKTATSLHYGFKRISVASWQEPDLPNTFFGYVSDSWVEAHLKHQLGSQVPADLAALFEVARGAMIYSWFFYPLATLGTEQCSRVLEAGVRIRCKNLGVPVIRMDKKGQPIRNKKGQEIDTSYSDNLAELIKRGVIPQDNENLWENAREFRNLASHPERQMILPPGTTWLMLQATADRLNELFA